MTTATKKPFDPTWAYVAPMAAFLLLTQAGVWWPDAYPWVYIAKTLLAATLLALFWRHYTTIRWTHLALGAAVGAISIVQWIGMEKLLLAYGPSWTHMAADPFVPTNHFSSPPVMWTWIALRWAGAFLVVPVMEELFWRDWVWRTIVAPNDFRLARVGEWDPTAFFGVAAVFACVHVQWLTAFVWACIIGALLWKTKSLGACIVAHGVANLLLGAYVLTTRDWYFW